MSEFNNSFTEESSPLEDETGQLFVRQYIIDLCLNPFDGEGGILVHDVLVDTPIEPIFPEAVNPEQPKNC